VLSAVATDVFGFQATAQETLPVLPNPAPVVQLLSPTPALRLTEGSQVVLAADASGAQPIQSVEFAINGTNLFAFTAHPYRAVYTIPLGTAQIAVTAVAHDAFGSSAVAGPVVVPVAPDNPPTATVIQPLDGATAVESTALQVVAGATDDVQVAQVRLYAAGALIATLAAPPFQTTLTVPAAGQDLPIYAVARDSVGQETTSPVVVVQAVPDPLTTVAGRVIDPNGAAVAGATLTVTAGSFAVGSSTAGADGTFSIPGMPTTGGNLAVLAASAVQGCPAQGSSPPVAPIAGGTTVVGAVTLGGTALTILSGTVVGPDSQPLAGATVQLSSADLADFATVTSGPGGTFAAPRFPLRLWSVGAFASATVNGVLVTGSSGPHSPVAGARLDLGTLQLQPLATSGPDPLTAVTGLVVAADGTTPVPSAQVVVDAGPYGLFTTTTGPDGTFVIAGVPTLERSVAVAASLHQACTLDNTGRPQNVSALVPGGSTDVGTLVLGPDRGPVIFFF
jgi:hypothetical protein